ncbi:hypothetical protein [Bacillus sp. FJAT-28004]|uniref:hypothetical protein n=1 Tax=Bacillus sp. FJAT-28004 TaxID=1679165 RepID=UPI0006B43AE5|nr:hypothetical protein [Bacillus sp. FJAT-28004]
MSAQLGFKAIQMINESLAPIIKSGKRIDRIKLVVCPTSPIAQATVVDTMYGLLLVVPGEYVKKGISYLIESPMTRGGIGFNWVSKQAVAK